MQLEMFVAVVEERSIRGAAERVLRTQPAVSMAVRKLEDEIGAQLFDRSGRQRYRLTDVGETLYTYASRILMLRTEVMSAIDDLSKPRTGLLHIGATESLCLYLLPELTRAFLEQYPGIRMEVMCEHSESLLRAVKDGKLDLALVPFRPRDAELESEFMAQDELVFIASSEHPLVARKRVELKDLSEESLLIMRDSQRSPWHKEVVDTFLRCNALFNVRIGNAPIEAIKKMVAIGIGVGLVPIMCVREERTRGELAVIEVDGFHQERSVSLVRRKGLQSPAAKTFVQLALGFAGGTLKEEPAAILDRATN